MAIWLDLIGMKIKDKVITAERRVIHDPGGDIDFLVIGVKSIVDHDRIAKLIDSLAGKTGRV